MKKIIVKEVTFPAPPKTTPPIQTKNHLIVIPRIVNNIGDWYQFPLGIAYISSYAKQRGFNIKTLNLNHVSGSTIEIIKDHIKQNDISTVSTGGVTGQYGAIRDVFIAAKQTGKEIITICGGGIISSDPVSAMEAIDLCDYGVIGEGELIYCDLLETLENGRDASIIPGLVYKNNNSFYKTQGNPKPVPIDDIPYPDYHGFNFSELLKSVPNTIGMSEYNTLPIITSRSCPFHCTFCFHPSGQTFRQRNLDDVFKEIDFLVSEFNVKYLSIQDELFLFGKKTDRVVEFCKKIKPYGIKWLAQFRVNDITEDLVDLLKKSNCGTMAFGIESADDRILKSMRKGIKVRDTERALEIVYKSGIGIQGVLIFGDPAETRETAENTIQWWKNNRHYELQLSMIITYPGTELYFNAVKKGLIKNPSDFIKNGCPVIKLSENLMDSDYKWITQQVISLPRTVHATPVGEINFSIDYAKSEIDISGLCAACGTYNSWEKSRLFVTETLSCMACGRKHVSPIPEAITTTVHKNIKALVSKHKKVALWGINSYIYSLFESMNDLSPSEIFFVDKSEIRHGVKIKELEIFPTSVIETNEIKCIIVSVVQYYSGLAGPIREEFNTVDELYCISDLLKPSFNT